MAIFNSKFDDIYSKASAYDILLENTFTINESIADYQPGSNNDKLTMLYPYGKVNQFLEFRPEGVSYSEGTQSVYKHPAEVLNAISKTFKQCHPDYTLFAPDVRSMPNVREAVKSVTVSLPFATPDCSPGWSKRCEGGCDPFWWSNVFLAFPVGVRQVRAFVSSFQNSQDGTSYDIHPAYIKSKTYLQKHHDTSYLYLQPDQAYYPLGGIQPDWEFNGVDNSGGKPIIDYLRIVNGTYRQGEAVESRTENYPIDHVNVKSVGYLLDGILDIMNDWNTNMNRIPPSQVSHKDINAAVEGGTVNDNLYWAANKLTLAAFTWEFGSTSTDVSSRSRVWNETEWAYVCEAILMSMIGYDTKLYGAMGEQIGNSWVKENGPYYAVAGSELEPANEPPDISPDNEDEDEGQQYPDGIDPLQRPGQL